MCSNVCMCRGGHRTPHLDLTLNVYCVCVKGQFHDTTNVEGKWERKGVWSVTSTNEWWPTKKKRHRGGRPIIRLSFLPVGTSKILNMTNNVRWLTKASSRQVTEADKTSKF